MSENRRRYAWSVTPGAELPTEEEALAAERKRRAEYEASEHFKRDEYYRRYREEKRIAEKEARKVAKGGQPLIGPPNPFAMRKAFRPPMKV